MYEFGCGCVCECECGGGGGVRVCVWLRVGLGAPACMFLSVLVRVSAEINAEINMNKLEYLCPVIAPNSMVLFATQSFNCLLVLFPVLFNSR